MVCVSNGHNEHMIIGGNWAVCRVQRRFEKVGIRGKEKGFSTDQTGTYRGLGGHHDGPGSVGLIEADMICRPALTRVGRGRRQAPNRNESG
jgi:hypothetical protein